jgi:hypothetical protein
VAERASVSLERREDDAALVRLVTVVEQVAVHAPSLPPAALTIIRAPP